MPRFRALALLLALHFAALAAGPANDFRFSILGDRTGTPDQKVYAQAWAEINRLRPDFVINVGDTIEGGADETAQAEWRTIRDFLNQYRRFPFYYVAGNHDVWSAFSRKLFEKETGRPTFYSFNYQNAHFVVLDNSQTLDLTLDQLQYLERDLQQNRQRSPKFVFFHQSFWIVFLKFQSGAFPLHRLAREYGVNYVVTGHGHFLFRMARDGVNYVQAGSSGAKLRPSFADGAFYHHLLVQVKGSEVRVTVKELDPPYGNGRSFNLEDWEGSKPKFNPDSLPASRGPSR